MQFYLTSNLPLFLFSLRFLFLFYLASFISPSKTGSGRREAQRLVSQSLLSTDLPFNISSRKIRHHCVEAIEEHLARLLYTGLPLENSTALCGSNGRISSDGYWLLDGLILIFNF